MEVSNLISLLIAAGALILSVVSTLRRNTKEDSSTIAKMMAMLDNLSKDVQEIKDDFRRDIAELKVNHQSDHDRIVIMERDLKTAWRAIEEVKLQVSHKRMEVQDD